MSAEAISTTTRRVERPGGVGIVTDLVLPERRPLARPGFLLVHGLASNARLYDGVAGALADAGHPSALVDLRGHGRSDKPDDGYDYDTLCDDLRAVLASLKADPGNAFERPVAVGQSFGGNLVLELAARVGSELSGVACIDGGTIDLKERFSSLEEARRVLKPPALDGTPYDELAERFSSAHPDWPEEGVRGSLANFEVRPDGSVAPWLTLERHLKILETMWSSRPSDIYPRIEIPVLLIPAETPGADSDWVRSKRKGAVSALAALERAEVRWFSPADHDVHAQFPREVAAVLLEAADELFE